jgi:hypothetical protein
VIAIAESFVWLHIHPTQQVARPPPQGGRSMHDRANRLRRILLFHALGGIGAKGNDWIHLVTLHKNTQTDW